MFKPKCFMEAKSYLCKENWTGKCLGEINPATLSDVNNVDDDKRQRKPEYWEKCQDCKHLYKR